MSTTTAKIIAETSAGMTALEIYQGNDLVWSLDYFSNGASQDWYKRGLRQIVDDAMACADWANFDGGETVQQNTSATTYVLMTWTAADGWTTDVEALHDGQASDLIKANSDRLPANIVALVA